MKAEYELELPDMNNYKYVSSIDFTPQVGTTVVVGAYRDCRITGARFNLKNNAWSIGLALVHDTDCRPELVEDIEREGWKFSGSHN